MPSSQQNVSAKRFPENLSQLLLPSVQPQTHKCKFQSHRYRNLRVNCHLPSEKTVLTIAGVYGGNEIAILTDALHTAELNELLNMDKSGVVEVVDGPQSQQVLSTRWVSKQRLDGS